MLQRELLEAGRERQRINWERIAQAVKYYESLGYRYIEVPWTVSPEATNVTYGGESLTSQAGDLLGSAEQAFIEYALMNKLPDEKLVAVSPCYRIESKYDDLHHLSFMKVELYWAKCIWQELLRDARGFFESLGIKDIRRELQPPGPYRIQQDLVTGPNNIELGSYGYRTQSGMKWSYGTGLAEPRTSVVLDGR